MLQMCRGNWLGGETHNWHKINHMLDILHRWRQVTDVVLLVTLIVCVSRAWIEVIWCSSVNKKGRANTREGNDFQYYLWYLHLQACLLCCSRRIQYASIGIQKSQVAQSDIVSPGSNMCTLNDDTFRLLAKNEFATSVKNIWQPRTVNYKTLTTVVGLPPGSSPSAAVANLQSWQINKL